MDKEQKYTFVEERIVSKRGRFRRVVMRVLVDVLLPVCVCILVCYGYLSWSGKNDDDKGEPVEPSESVEAGSGDTEEESSTESLDINSDEDLVKLEEKLNRMLVVVSVVRENPRREIEPVSGDETEASQEDGETSTAETETADESSDIVTKYTGAIVSMNGPVYILIPYSNVEGGREIYTTFTDGMVETTLYDVDTETGLALLKIESTKVPYDVKSSFDEVKFAGNNSLEKGTSVVYCGNVVGNSPMFFKGHVSNISNQVICTDFNYDVIITDIMLENVCDGFIFNSQGELAGVAGLQYGDLNIPGAIAGGEVDDLKYIIDNMLNDKRNIYFGIEGQEVTAEIEEIVGGFMPKGLYVSRVEVDSPAYNAGVMPGDIIVSIGNVTEPDMESFRSLIENKTKGDEVRIKVKRKIGDTYNEYDIKVILGSRD